MATESTVSDTFFRVRIKIVIKELNRYILFTVSSVRLHTFDYGRHVCFISSESAQCPAYIGNQLVLVE